VLLRLGHLQGSWAELQALRRLILKLAEKKEVIAFLASPDLRGLWLASAAQQLWLPPHLPVQAVGIAAEMNFYGESLERLGLEVDVIAAGRFKSAMEPFTQTGPSEENAEAINALLDSLYKELLAEMGHGWDRDPEEISRLFDQGPLLSDQLKEQGLAQKIIREDELAKALDFHKEGKLREIDPEEYRGPSRPLPEVLRRPRLGLIEVHGIIRDGRNDDPEPSGATVRAVCDALEMARKDRHIKGVLLHIDSQGGSATASERIWQGVRTLAREKPVVAWMGGVAASGGYYIASAAHRIVAAPQTLTGSIGVISSKPVVQSLLERLGIRQVRFERGAHSSIFSLGRHYSDSERHSLERIIQEMYQLFLRRVAEGRKLPQEEIEAVAEGRVWSGAQAAELGLVDLLGSEEDALKWLAKRAEVQNRENLKLFQPQRSFWRRLMPRLAVQAPALELIKLHSEGGPLAWCSLRLL